MRKVLFVLFNLLAVAAMAQTKGRFEVKTSVTASCTFITLTMHWVMQATSLRVKRGW